MVDLADPPTAALVVDRTRTIVAPNADAGSLAGRDLVGVAPADVLGAADEDPPWEGWHPSAALRSVRGIPERAARLRLPDGHRIPVLAAGRYRRDDTGAI